MKVDEAIVRIEEMISLFGKEADTDDEFLEMLDEMSDRAVNARNARAEELHEGKGSQTSSGT